MSSPLQAPFEVECQEVEIVETPGIVMYQKVIEEDDEVEEEEIYVGKAFDSFEALETFIRKFESDHKQKFWIRSSRSVEAARKILKRPLSEKIRYYELQYSCIHGGLDFKSRGKGIRNMSTHKMNCPAKIKLRATPDGNKLEIRSFVAVHEGHTMSEDVFQLLPQNRRNAKTGKLRKFLTVDNLRGKKRKVPADLIEETLEEEQQAFTGAGEDDISFKEFSNASCSNEISKSLSVLKYEYGANTMALYDDTNAFKGLYFHTEDMKKSLFAWPEVVYIWGVQHWLRYNFTVVLASIKDSNGMYDVVGVAVLSEDDKDSLQWFLQAFRNIFSSYERLPIKCIFSYAAIVEELQTVFPDVEVRISTHYSVRAFNKVLSTGTKFVASNKEREICVKLFNKMLLSKTQDEYKMLNSLFRKVAPSFIVNYFAEEWEPTKNRWAVHNFPPYSLVDLNKPQKENSLDNRLKQVIPKDSTILTFLKQLLRWLDSLKAQTSYRTSVHILKKPVVAPSKGSWQDLYSSLLTQYAFNYVSQQVIQSSSVNVLGETDEGMYIVQEDSNCFCVGPENCQCLDWLSMRLPCRHVLSVRNFLSMPCFCESLCDVRWSKQYYLDTRLNINGPPDRTQESKSKPSTNPRYSKKAMSVVETLLRIMHDDDRLDGRIANLEKIAQTWALGYDVSISVNKPIEMEAQEVVEEELCFDEHDPEIMGMVKSEPDDGSQMEISFPESTVQHAAIVEVPEDENMSCASVLLKFDAPKTSKTANPVKFALKTDKEKVAMMLGMISKSRELMDECLRGDYVLTAVDIELEPSNIKHSILHESVDLDLLEPYLEPPALQELKLCVKQKRSLQVWQCFICEMDLDDDCVLCCSCLVWFHPKCVGLPSPQKRKLWFCYSCHQQASK